MARAALKPDGYIALGDTERPDPAAPVAQGGAISGVLFYAWSHGRNFTADEISGWLHEAGFADVEVSRSERSPWRIVLTGRA